MTLFPLIFALAVSNPAATIRVAPGGMTIQAAIDKALPGDVIELAAGTYAELAVAYRRPGPITLAAKPGAIIDGECVRTWGVRLFDCPDWTIDGLTVQRVEGNGIAADSCADRTVIRGCTVRECQGGIVIMSSDDCLVEGCEVTACSVGIGVVGVTMGEGRGFDRTGDYVPCMRPIIRRCMSHDNSRDNPPNALEGNDGIVVKCSRDALIEDSFSWNNPDDGIDTTAGGGGHDYPLRTRMIRCAAWHNGWQGGGGDGSGLKMGTNAGGGHVIYRGIAWGNEHDGINIDQEAGWAPCMIVNCTSVGNGTYGIGLDLAGLFNPIEAPSIVNCVLGGNWLEAVHRSGMDALRFDHNRLDADCLRDPLFLPTIPTTGTIAERWQVIRSQIDEHFGLMPGSSCVSAGVAMADFPPDFLDLGALPSGALPVTSQPALVEERTTRLIRSAAETLFYACASGPGMPLPAPACGLVDLDHDGDCDLDDWGALERIVR